MNKLTNPGFEGSWTRKTHTGQEFGEIFVPEGWTAFWKEGGDVPHDPGNAEGYGRPEMQVINREPPFLDPPRVRTGNRALKYFTFYRIHDAGVYQQVDGVSPGDLLSLKGWAHAWSSNIDNAHESDTDTSDAMQNITFRLGIDPYGGTDPWGDSVVWGPSLPIYDEYGEIPPLKIKAKADEVTVFVRSSVLWPLKHCDVYMDDISLEVESVAPEPSGPIVEPRVEYDRTYVLMPPDADGELASAAVKATWDQKRWTVGGSADDAGFGLRDHRTVVIVNPSAWPDNIVQFFDDHYRGIKIILAYGETPEALAADLRLIIEGKNEPANPPSGGSLMGVHTFDDGGIVGVYEEIAKHGTPPSIKVYGTPGKFGWLKDIKAIDENIITVARLSGVPGSDFNVEGVNLSNPIHAAHDMFEVCKDVWLEHLDYVDYYEVINEQDAEDHVQLARFFEELMRIVRPYGIKLGLFSYSMGVPEKEEWAAMRDQTDVFQMALDDGHMIALHEYGFIDAHYPYLIGRFEWAYEEIHEFIDAGLPIFITEWNVTDGLAPISREVWMEEVKAYEELCKRYGWIDGVHIFTFGSSSAGGAWSDYDPEAQGWLETWEQYVISQFGEGGEQSPPDPIDPVYVADGLPQRTDYENMLGALHNRGWWQRDLSQIDGLTIHHTAGDWAIRDVAEYHINEKCYGPTPSIHYHIWIEKDGKVYQVNDFENGIWHDNTGDRNTHLAVVLNGALHQQQPTEAQLSSLVKIVNYYINDDRMNITWDRVKGHQDYADTVCPGWQSQASGYWKQDFLERTQGGDPVSLSGVHAPINEFPVESVDKTVERLQSMDLQFYKLLFNGDRRHNGPDTIDLVRGLCYAGIQPIVRLYQPQQLPGRNAVITEKGHNVETLINAFGDKPALIEIMNEPNLASEWDNTVANFTWGNNDLIAELCESWWEDAMWVIGHGGRAAIPAMAPTDRGGVNYRYSGAVWLQRFVEHISLHYHGLGDLLYAGQVWLATHSAAFTRPFDFDPFRPDGYVDDMCLRSYEIGQRFIYNMFDVYPYTISTEGGVYSPQHMNQIGWSTHKDFVLRDGSDAMYYNNKSWGDKVEEAFDWLASQSKPLALDGMCMWNLSDEGSATEWHGNGWYAEGWQPRSPVRSLS